MSDDYSNVICMTCKKIVAKEEANEADPGWECHQCLTDFIEADMRETAKRLALTDFIVIAFMIAVVIAVWFIIT